MTEHNELLDEEEQEDEPQVKCNEEVCEAQEGLDAFCGAVTDSDAKVKCINIMSLVKQGQQDADIARSQLIEELGEEHYKEGAIALQQWLTAKIPPKVDNMMNLDDGVDFGEEAWENPNFPDGHLLLNNDNDDMLMPTGPISQSFEALEKPSLELEEVLPLLEEEAQFLEEVPNQQSQSENDIESQEDD